MKYITVVLLLGLVVGVIIGIVLSAFVGLDISAISKEEAGNKTLTYITTNILEPQGLSAELANVEEYGNDLYIVNLKIKDNNKTIQDAAIFITKSGDSVILGRIVNITGEM